VVLTDQTRFFRQIQPWAAEVAAPTHRLQALEVAAAVVNLTPQRLREHHCKVIAVATAARTQAVVAVVPALLAVEVVLPWAVQVGLVLPQVLQARP
jgi:hypothetical protein